jgi:hypothetical protein
MEKAPSPISSRVIPIAAVIGLILFSGVVHGYLDGRWSQANDLKAQGELLQQLPEMCGDWQLAKTEDLDAGAMQLLRCHGSTVRVYRHREKEDSFVNVAIMFGPRGPIAVHTPEVCYDSVGTEQTADRRVESISTVQSRHELWTVPFSRDNRSEEFEVWYAWSDGGSWQAAKHPRFWATDNLYKIQLAGPVSRGAEDPCRDFLEKFLPQVEKVLR